MKRDFTCAWKACHGMIMACLRIEKRHTPCRRKYADRSIGRCEASARGFKILSGYDGTLKMGEIRQGKKDRAVDTSLVPDCWLLMAGLLLVQRTKRWDLAKWH